MRSAALDELRRTRTTVVTAELTGSPNGIDRVPGLHDVDLDGAMLRCRVEAEHLNDLLLALTAAGVRSSG